jgi:hypothetical protein
MGRRAGGQLDLKKLEPIFSFSISIPNKVSVVNHFFEPIYPFTKLYIIIIN